MHKRNGDAPITSYFVCQAMYHICEAYLVRNVHLHAHYILYDYMDIYLVLFEYNLIYCINNVYEHVVT